MLISLLVVMGFIQIFLFQQQSIQIQTIADSIADGTANKMAITGNATYEIAEKEAEKIKNYYKRNLKQKVDLVTIDRDQFEKGNIKITVKKKTNKILSSFNIQTISRFATTTFQLMNGDLVGLARSKLGTPYWWGRKGPNYFDCSGLVYWCYKQLGATGTYKTTQGLIQTFQGTKYEVAKENLQPGDLILCNDGHHVVIFMGNDQVIGANGGGSETCGDDTNAKVSIKQYSTTYEASTTHIFRIPIEVY